MPPRLQAVFYRAGDGSEPVDDFVESLGDPAKQAAIDNQIDRLNLLTPSNPHLPFPHSSQVRGELRELRCHYGSELYRILYRRSRNLIVLLHMFAKTPARSPSERFGSPRSAGKTSRRGWTPRSGGHRELRVTMLRERTYQFW
jgi:putative component of toxin-antitoxin plasmid stabilization module